MPKVHRHISYHKIQEGLETEIDFGENAKAYIADKVEKTTENIVLDLSGKSDIYESLNRKLTKDQLEHLKQITQRRRFLENFQKSKQEDFLRPTQEEKEIISSLISNRKNIANLVNNRKMPHGQDLEFGGVGLFGNKRKQQLQESLDVVTEITTTNRDLDMDKEEESEDRTIRVQEMLSYRDREDAEPTRGDIYDMSSYIAQDSVPKTRRPGSVMETGLSKPKKTKQPKIDLLNLLNLDWDPIHYKQTSY